MNPNDFWKNTWKENTLLGESHVIKLNIAWEQTRYLATMIHNVNCQKRSQMKKPEQLFRLPQDNMKRPFKPKSSPESLEKFLNKMKQSGLEI